LSPTPIFNWLLFGYGVPAASFALAGFSQQEEDMFTKATLGLAVTLST
jgi:uncharacterized membrane protein